MSCPACKSCPYNVQPGGIACNIAKGECTEEKQKDCFRKRVIRVGLIGNANVGKSLIFNQMTGLEQTTGNWAGKTIEMAKGKALYCNQMFEIVDLPGVYSLSSYSEEEEVTRDYITGGGVDVVVNVADATALKRNLYLTLQVLEIGIPVVIALNKMDVAKKKGLMFDIEKLSKVLGVPIVETVGLTGQGLEKLMEETVQVLKTGASSAKYLRYGKEVESRVRRLQKRIAKPIQGFPPRFLASKLLEGDRIAATLVVSRDTRLLKLANRFQDELSAIHGEDSSTVITSERYSLSHRISQSVTDMASSRIITWSDRLDLWTTHPVFGYIILGVVMVGIFFTIFNIGDIFSGWLMQLYEWGGREVVDKMGGGWAYRIIWEGGAQGFIAALAFVLPYILPFYIFLAVLEDSGYLARVAVLMDSLMHKFGLHGKAFIPMILGYGCSVPAVLGTRILDTKRERFISSFLSTMIPCAARTIVIMALIGAFMGWYWALGFYFFNLLVIVGLGQLVTRLLPGKAYGLIMEVPNYHIPHFKMVLKQSWMRLKDFIVVALPIIVVGSIVLVLFEYFKFTGPVNTALSPVTSGILGLPVAVGVILLLGILRKELTLVMLVALWGNANFSEHLSAVQMIVFTLFVMFYIPCVSTLAALFKEFRIKATLLISLAQFTLALIIAGAANLLFHLL